MAEKTEALTDLYATRNQLRADVSRRNFEIGEIEDAQGVHDSDEED